MFSYCKSIVLAEQPVLEGNIAITVRIRPFLPLRVIAIEEDSGEFEKS